VPIITLVKELAYNSEIAISLYRLFSKDYVQIQIQAKKFSSCAGVCSVLSLHSSYFWLPVSLIIDMIPKICSNFRKNNSLLIEEFEQKQLHSGRVLAFLSKLSYFSAWIE